MNESLVEYGSKNRNKFENKQGKTLQDIMSENYQETIKKWIDEGYIMLSNEKDILNLDPKKNLKVRYITKKNECRMGGKLSKIIDIGDVKYITILSFCAGFRSFSTQLKNIKYLFYKDINLKKVPTDDEKTYHKLLDKFKEYKREDAKNKTTIKAFWNYLTTPRTPLMFSANNDPHLEFLKGNFIQKRHVSYFINKYKNKTFPGKKRVSSH